MLDSKLGTSNVGRMLTQLTEDDRLRRQGKLQRYRRPKYGVGQKIESYSQLIMEMDDEPLFFNEIDIELDGMNGKTIVDLLLTQYNKESRAVDIPSCKCGALGKSTYIKDVGANKTVCDICHSPVEQVNVRKLQPSMWIRKPDYLKGLIPPVMLALMTPLFTISGRSTLGVRGSLIPWLISNRAERPYPRNQQAQEFMDRIMDIKGYKRSVNSFYTHFDTIVEMLYEEYIAGVKQTKSNAGGIKYRKASYDVIQRYRELVWQDYIPIPSKDLFIVETTDFTTNTDKLADEISDVVMSIAGIERQGKRQNTKEQKYARAMLGLTDFYAAKDGFYQNALGKKPGIQRAHNYGFRSDFSIRGVITSIADDHDSSIIEVPWSLGVQSLGDPIRSKLLAKGLSPVEIDQKLRYAISNYSEEIHDIIRDIIKNTESGELLSVIQRNPSLRRLSIQAVRTLDFKTDPRDKTIGFSILYTKGPNADYDGDQMHIKHAIDGVERDLLGRLRRFYGNMDFNKPNTPSGVTAIPNETAAMWSSASYESRRHAQNS